MKVNYKAIITTLILYAIVLFSIYLTDKFYIPRGANDITGPPFIVAILGGIAILISFFRSIFSAIKKEKSYWLVVILHLILISILLNKFFL